MKSFEPCTGLLPPLSLYVHIPWCVKKCPYCDFNSHAKNGALPISDYVDALKKDLAQDAHYAQGRRLQSIFFGGGTPSLFPGAAISEIICFAGSVINFESDIEITLEANPGTTEHHTFSDLLEAGVNRLSLGVQSFNNSHLQKLGRIHSADDALSAITAAQSAGFANMNVDLMHGLPGQTKKEALADLEQAVNLQTSHLSWYQLTIEPNTQFYSAPPILPPEDALWDIQQAGLAFLNKHGFERYEVSAYARDKMRARHNLNYWCFGDYLGIGAGAHGKITDKNQIFRTAKSRQPSDYMARGSQPDLNFTTSLQTIDEHNLIVDFMLNALRLSQGTELSEFTHNTRLAPDLIADKLAHLRKKGLLVDDPGRIAASAKGFDFLDTILQEFMPN